MAIHVCTWLYMAIHGYTWLYMVIHGCTWLYLALHCYTWLYMAIHDIFFIWTHGEEKLKNFFNLCNSFDPPIKFEETTSTTSILFLDVQVINNNGKLITDLYTKPTDTHQYLNWTRGPFLERPGNLTGPKSYFEIKFSRKAGRFLTSNEVHFVSLADNFTVQFSNLLKLLSRMTNKTA